MDEYKGYGYITALKKVPGHVQAELFYFAPGGKRTGAGGTYFKTVDPNLSPFATRLLPEHPVPGRSRKTSR